MPYVVEGALKDAIALADGRGGIDVQGRSELPGELVEGQSVTMKFIALVRKSWRPREHERGF
jgi:hypothetical protein